MEIRALRHSDSGQAAVEFVALVPLIVLLGWFAWQGALAGITAARVARAANSAARAAALGANGAAAARAALPGGVRRAARIKVGSGRATVRLPVPAVIPGLQLGSLSASGTFPEQG